MKEFFPESLGQKHGCALYMAKYNILHIAIKATTIMFQGGNHSLNVDNWDLK